MLSEKWVLPEKPERRNMKQRGLRMNCRPRCRGSLGGGHVRVESGHLIPLEKPEVIVDAVRTILLLTKHK